MRYTSFHKSKLKYTLLGCSILVAPAAFAQDDFDPMDPFAGLASGSAWVEKFTVEAEPDPNDHFHNLTSGQWWTKTWNGQWSDAAKSGMSFEEFYETLQGDSGDSFIIESPYPFESAEEHWNAWMEAASGGSKHTAETLPNWSGDWEGGGIVVGGGAQVSDVYAAVSDEYKPRFQQALQAELEGSHWWPADTCLPNGYMRDGWTMRYAMLDENLFLMAEDQPLNEYRVTYHDGRGFVPDELTFPMWYGQSQGFWDEDELIVWVKDIKGWFAGHGLPEYTDNLEIIERWKRIKDEIVVDITMYDPIAFAYPWHEIALFVPRKDWTQPPPTHNECVSTNNVYHDELGRINEFGPTDPRYINIFDLRPWEAVFQDMEEAKAEGRLPEAPNFMTFSTQPK